VLLTHARVAKILRFSGVSPAEVKPEPQSPHRDERKDEHAARRISVAERDGDEGDDDEAGAPVHVDDARVSKAKAHEPQDEHREADGDAGRRENPRLLAHGRE
jgi:hypothetical protein